MCFMTDEEGLFDEWRFNSEYLLRLCVLEGKEVNNMQLLTAYNMCVSCEIYQI